MADTIRVTGASAVLIGPEGRTPPLPFITVDEAEGLALIAQKLATHYTGTDELDVDPEAEAKAAAEAEPAPDTVTPPAEPEPEPEAEPEPDPETAPAPNAPEGGEGGTEGASRAETIREALDLMEAGDLVKNGDRAGKPKVSAMEAATGINDLTAEEIDAAVAARDAE